MRIVASAAQRWAAVAGLALRLVGANLALPGRRPGAMSGAVSNSGGRVPPARERLRAMSEKSAGIGRSDAAEVIVRECYDVMGRRHETNRSVGAI